MAGESKLAHGRRLKQALSAAGEDSDRPTPADRFQSYSTESVRIPTGNAAASMLEKDAPASNTMGERCTRTLSWSTVMVAASVTKSQVVTTQRR